MNKTRIYSWHVVYNHNNGYKNSEWTREKKNMRTIVLTIKLSFNLPAIRLGRDGTMFTTELTYHMSWQRCNEPLKLKCLGQFGRFKKSIKISYFDTLMNAVRFDASKFQFVSIEFHLISLHVIKDLQLTWPILISQTKKCFAEKNISACNCDTTKLNEIITILRNSFKIIFFFFQRKYFFFLFKVHWRLHAQNRVNWMIYTISNVSLIR